MLKVQGLSAGYGDLIVVRDVSLDVAEGEFVAIVGSNAAGKSTLIRSTIGLLPRATGTVTFDGQRVERLAPYQLAQRGLAVVLEHSVIAKMSVHDNLLLGAYRSQARVEINRTLDESFALFPILAERRTQLAGSLSGGEQQMLCVARALMSRPRMIVLDEPSVGLSPMMVSTILQSLAALNKRGLTILLAEQNVVQTLRIASRAYVIEGGSIRMQAPSAELMNNARMREAYLGM
jgi:branched-chain amino acid transport system ATP-binding protein